MLNDLDYVKQKLNDHDKLMVRMVELSERQAASSDKLNDHIIRNDKRLDKMEIRIESNHSTILRWSGGIGAVVAAVGFIVMVTRLFPNIGG